MNQWVANPGLFSTSSATAGGRESAEVREMRTLSAPRVWNPESFEREQIRGLVRQVFLSDEGREVHQVLFSPLEPETDVHSVCRLVGETLAAENVGDVAVVGRYPQVFHGVGEELEGAVEDGATRASAPLRRQASRARSNLWLVSGGPHDATFPMYSHLSDLRLEFSYTIAEGLPVGESQETIIAGQQADGVILVLSARRTRRASARRFTAMLQAARVRILGIVLSDRDFPIPEEIYRRL